MIFEKTDQIRISAWEKRLPRLNHEWPHWWLEGGSVCIGVAENNNIHKAIEIIKNNWQRYPSVYAYRAKTGVNGDILRQEHHRTEVSNMRIDS